MSGFQGAIFDVDGVLADSPHEKAWRESLRELMDGGCSDIRDRATWSPQAFTPHVYEQEMSGKPRMSGARAALEYFHVPDDDDDHRVAEYADHKQAMVVRLIEAGDFAAYPDAYDSSSPSKTPASGSRQRPRRRRPSCSWAFGRHMERERVPRRSRDRAAPACQGVTTSCPACVQLRDGSGEDPTRRVCR